MRLAILGGAFNPIHKGHLALASCVREEWGCEEILFIPSHRAPHKESFDLEPDLRLEMLKKAIEPYSWMTFSAYEIERGGVSYTIDTLLFLQEQRVLEDKPGLIIGDDLLTTFPTWKEWKKILERVILLVARRLQEAEIPFPYPHKYLHNPLMCLSSQEVRERVFRGQEVTDLLPPGIASFIETHGLYRKRGA